MDISESVAVPKESKLKIVLLIDKETVELEEGLLGACNNTELFDAFGTRAVYTLFVKNGI